MTDEARIKVSVDGADEAEKDLGRVEDAVEQLGGASESGASGVRAANQATGETGAAAEKASEELGKLGQQQTRVDGTAKAFASGLGGALNPELGSMVNLVADGVEGFGKMSAGLLGVVAGAAGLTLVVSLYEQLAEQAREAAAAIERQVQAERDRKIEGVEGRSTLAEDLTRAGISAASTGDIQSQIERLQQDGVLRDVARQGAIAAALAAGLGQDVTPDDAARAHVARRLQPFNFTDRNEFQRQLKEGLDFARGERSGFVDSFFAETAGAARIQASEDGTGPDDDRAEFETAIEVEIARLKQSRPDISDRKLSELRRVALLGSQRIDQIADSPLLRQLSSQEPTSFFESIYNSFSDDLFPGFLADDPDEDFTAGDAAAASTIAGRARETVNRSQQIGRPQIVNITNVNVGTSYGNPLEQFGRPQISPDSAVLGGP